MIESISQLRALAADKAGRGKYTSLYRRDLAMLLDVYDAARDHLNGRVCCIPSAELDGACTLARAVEACEPSPVKERHDRDR